MHALIELNLRRNQLTSAEGLQALPALQHPLPLHNPNPYPLTLTLTLTLTPTP